MEEERIYKLKNGQEMVLLATENYNGIRYLLLVDEKTDDIQVGFEENNNLILIDKQNPYFSDILIMLVKKLRSNINI
ncbi:MAG: hypothetical protein ACI31V_02140 [Bacilli bacterium]